MYTCGRLIVLWGWCWAGVGRVWGGYIFGGFVYKSGRDDGGMAWDFDGLLLGVIMFNFRVISSGWWMCMWRDMRSLVRVLRGKD